MVNERKINLIELDKVKAFLLISEQDLECAEILYNYEKYPNSVWMIFQSIEKITKCLALMMGAMKSGELKDGIGHNPLKTYIKNISDNLQKAKILEDAIKRIPELKELPFIRELDLKDFKEKGQAIKTTVSLAMTKERIFSDDINELDSVINEMDRLIGRIKNLDMGNLNEIQFKQHKEAWEKNINAYIKLSEKQGKPMGEAEKEQARSISDETFKGIIDNTRKNLVLQGATQALNAMLNVLISPHFNFLRYPDLKNPLEYYTKQNPIIMRLNKLMAIQKENISLHKEYFEILEKEYSKIIVEK